MSSSKNFNQLWQGIQELKETMLIKNKRLDKLTAIENKLDGIQQKMVEYENKLNQLEKEKEQLRDKMVQKTNLLTSIYLVTALPILHFIPRAKDVY